MPVKATINIPNAPKYGSNLPREFLVTGGKKVCFLAEFLVTGDKKVCFLSSRSVNKLPG